MTKYVAPKCTLYCFFARESARRTNKYDQIDCSEVYFVLFFARESARVAHTYDPICCPEVHFVLFFARESARMANTYDPRCCPEVHFVLFFARDCGGVLFFGPGWPPVAWGRGCLLIGNSDKPLPEGEEGGWKRNLSKPLTP